MSQVYSDTAKKAKTKGYEFLPYVHWLSQSGTDIIIPKFSWPERGEDYIGSRSSHGS